MKYISLETDIRHSIMIVFLHLLLIHKHPLPSHIFCLTVIHHYLTYILPRLTLQITTIICHHMKTILLK